ATLARSLPSLSTILPVPEVTFRLTSVAVVVTVYGPSLSPETPDLLAGSIFSAGPGSGVAVACSSSHWYTFRIGLRRPLELFSASTDPAASAGGGASSLVDPSRLNPSARCQIAAWVALYVTCSRSLAPFKAALAW